MQNKQAIIGIIAAAIILVGAGGVFLFTQNKKSSEPNNTAAPQTQEQATMESDLASILKSGKTQQCTFTYSDEKGYSVSGTSYMTGAQMRTDVQNAINGKTSTIYVIRDGDDNYIWGSDFPNNTGMKMTMSIDEYATNEDSKKYFDPNMKADYDCKDWTAESTKFVPPANIKFQDLSSLMKGVMSTSKSPTGGQSECSICNSLTGDAKSACMKQFSC